MPANADTLARLHERIFRPSHDPTRPILTYITGITAAIDTLFLAGHTLDARAIVDSVIAHLHPSWAKVRNKLERRGGKDDDLLEVVIMLMKYQETEELRGMLKDDQDRAPDASVALISDGEQAVLAQKPLGPSCDLPAEPRSTTFRPKQNSQLVLDLDLATSDAEKSFDHPIPDYLEFAREAESSSFTTSPVRSTFSDSDSHDSSCLTGLSQSRELVGVNRSARHVGVPDYTQFAREMDQALDAAVLGRGRVAFIVDRRLHIN
ncbi:hypothetical protein EWM64_g5762 [Hericium alpestre]|uniref:Uncharacterized protein n=1 Tax=Hericium alpestre TaxID=135208 RepID=A0A4Y9ZWH3_9AGAM|nr:hypothetical protein EWM64_g5762 [Hericium alpestre]